MRTSAIAALLWLVAVPATAQAADPASESRAAWERQGSATFTLDQDALADVLQDAPIEGRRTVRTLTVSVPAPDGDFERFAVVESPVMEPGLAAAHPELKTYTARGLDDRSATARLDLTPLGFHAAVRSASGAWYVDPRDGEHVAYRRDSAPAPPFEELGDPAAFGTAAAPRTAPATAGGDPVTLRVYRLALVSNPTYGTATPGTTTAAKVVLVNRLNQIYEQDLAIRLLLVAGNDQLNLDTAAAATGANGPCGAAACYTATQLQTCTGDTLERTNAVAGRILGAGSYDLAHLVMAANGGGIAGLGVVGTAFKGRACTALPNPVGDAFDVDFVAHEVGHQFGGEHTFNSRQCMGNLADTGAVRVEPGSGSSIMAYAGTCGADDLQDHSDPYFSQASVAQIGTQARRAEESQPAVQQVALNGFGGGDGFAFSYNGATSARVTESVNFTTNAIRNAIQGIAGWPAGAQVTVTGLSQRGFLVYFFGLAAPARLEVVDPAGFNGGFTAVVAENGATRFGGAPQATANRTPSVALRGAATYTIPARTPFLLDATGSDLDGDPLTYLWEQNDPGGDTNGTPLFDAARTDGPLFRIFGDAPVVGANAAGTATWRSFPDVDQVLDDNTNAVRACADVTCFSEFLPTGAWLGIGGNRTMHFRVTARDNHPGFGGLEAADVALTVAPGAGPFRLTSQATAGATTGGAALPVTWAVAGTDANGVNASQVKISLSLDGGRTFSKVLAAATPNDGSELVAVPRVGTADGRIKVEAVGNVFYDAARGALAIDSGFPVLLNGPPSADLGAASVGAAGAVTTITFTSDGPAPVSTGALTLGGADAGAVSIVSDGCSGRLVASYGACAVTVRLVPTRGGAQSATLSLASNDPTSPTTVALTGLATATPPPAAPGGGGTPVTPIAPVFDPRQAAAGLLGTRSPFAAGTAGNLRLFTKNKSTRLGKPKATMTLAAAVCSGGSCSGKATAKLTLTPRKGRKRAYNFTLVRSLKLADRGASLLRLKLSRSDRTRIGAARKAALTLTVTNGSRRVSRTFTLTT